MDSSQIDACVMLSNALGRVGYGFVTVTPLSHARVLNRRRGQHARDLRDVFGWSLPFDPPLLDRPVLDLLRSTDLVDQSGAAWRSRVRFSTLGGRLFMHSSFPTEQRNAVFFGPDTFKFADAIDLHLSRRTGPGGRAADICSGAGPGALTIAARHPDAEVLMIDINHDALAYADVNARAAGLRNAKPQYSNLLSDVAGTFDLIVAHPPYLIDRSARTYRHGGGELGADLALSIVREGLARLSDTGSLLLFTGIAIVDGYDPFRAAVERILREAGASWTYREVDSDVFGEELEQAPYDQADRIALVVLEASR